MKKLKICVLMGGNSPEHEISILSGKEVIKNLDQKKYEISPIVISKKGVWQLTNTESILNIKNPIKNKGSGKDIVLQSKEHIDAFYSKDNKKIDIFFIVMHGPFGEDGKIQGMLDLIGMKYTGSGVLASALGMDKLKFRKIMVSEKLPIPKYLVFKKGNYKKEIYKCNQFPYFIKPHDQGSSVGTSIAKNKAQLLKSMANAFKFSDTILVDKYIKGREFTCGVLGDKKPFALSVVEIIPKRGEFFDYISKYTESGSEEIAPAKISRNLERHIKSLAIRVFQAIGASGFGRIDFLMDSKNKLYILEINTIPGLTKMSLLPKSAKASGLTYSKLLDKIIEYAI